MQELWFSDYLRELNMASITLRIIFCIICGGAVGIEREWKHRTAGFKTHILVCLGSAACMLTGQYAVLMFHLDSIDPTRIGAQVVSGIGFLGVGTIIVRDNAKVKGLTTAAGLWVSACVGLAIGIGFYELAILATICVVVLFLLGVQKKLFGGSDETNMTVYIELKDQSCIRALLKMLQEQDCDIYRMEMQRAKVGVNGEIGLILGIQSDSKESREILSILSKEEDVVGFEEIGI